MNPIINLFFTITFLFVIVNCLPEQGKWTLKTSYPNPVSFYHPQNVDVDL